MNLARFHRNSSAPADAKVPCLRSTIVRASSCARAWPRLLGLPFLLLLILLTHWRRLRCETIREGAPPVQPSTRVSQRKRRCFNCLSRPADTCPTWPNPPLLLSFRPAPIGKHSVKSAPLFLFATFAEFQIIPSLCPITLPCQTVASLHLLHLCIVPTLLVILFLASPFSFSFHLIVSDPTRSSHTNDNTLRCATTIAHC